MSDDMVIMTLEEEMEKWLDDDMRMSERWRDISSTMNSIANNAFYADIRKRYQCKCQAEEENEDIEEKIQFHWQLTKRKYIRYREQFMTMDFDNEDKSEKGKMYRDILERALAQDAESIILGAEVEF